MRMHLGGFDAEEPGGPADVAESLERGEVEFLGEGFEVHAGDARHGAEKLFELREFCVEFLEDALLAVLGFVLGFTGAEGFGQVVPKLEQAGIEHDENAANIAGAALVKVQRAGGRVAVGGRGAVTFAFEELHGDQGVEKIADGARVETEFGAEFRAGETVIVKRGEDAELDGSEEYLRGPKGEGGLEDGAGVNGWMRHSVVVQTYYVFVSVPLR